MFLRVFLASGRGPRMVQEIDSYVFYNVLLECGPHHTCFYVSVVVAASCRRRLAGFGAMVISCMLVPFGRIIRENTCHERWSRNDLSIESYALWKQRAFAL